jgi:type I restriction enzyme S subunit
MRVKRYAHPRFVAFSLLSPSIREQQIEPMRSRAAQPHLNAEELGDIELMLPPLDEQRAIVDYLDRATARLDGLVSAKERLLGLLAEKRRALITRAVTRGLDPCASLRDSGIPWLGEVPAHWGIWKVSHFADVGNGSTPSRDNAEYWTEGLIPWLNSSVVNQEEVTEADQFITEKAFRECHLPLVKSGSVLVGITGQGKTRGQAVVLSFEATINQHLAFITPKKGAVDLWFLRWALFAAYDFLRSISDDAGGTKGALTCEEVGALRMPLPPIDEQRAIVAYIAAETARLDALRSATERTIALLKERRVALIAAAVTGRMIIHESIGDNLPGGSFED